MTTTIALPVTLTTWHIDGKDWDGEPEHTTIEAVWVDADTCEVRVYVGDDLVDMEEFDDTDEADRAAERRAREARKEYRERERDRLKEVRDARRQALLDAAEEMDGPDEEAVKTLARLLGQGKGAEALAALLAVK